MDCKATVGEQEREKGTDGAFVLQCSPKKRHPIQSGTHTQTVLSESNLVSRE